MDVEKIELTGCSDPDKELTNYSSFVIIIDN